LSQITHFASKVIHNLSNWHVLLNGWVNLLRNVSKSVFMGNRWFIWLGRNE
jgi:hypothetical protein